jgi:general L-amino acid transport system permease protein
MAENAVRRSEVLPPPSQQAGPWGWARKNLFSTWYNTLLTLVALAILIAILPGLNLGTDPGTLGGDRGQPAPVLMTGTYPPDQLWRAWLVLHLLAAIGGLTWGVWVRGRRMLGMLPWPPAHPGRLFGDQHRIAAAPGRSQRGSPGILHPGPPGRTAPSRTVIGAWLLYFPLVILIIGGVPVDGSPLPVVPTNLWGGLMLTFLLTVVGILVSFPLGVMLALGRRSNLPVVRWVSVAYIEIIRGVPLITILFMASNMVPLFLPGGTNIDRVLRAMIGMTLFSAAYLAENVRGGLQAIPRGQYEAAQALGLNGATDHGPDHMPQALRLVIPVLVGQFISLFKDTTLVATIGLLDLLGIARSVLAQPQFISYQHEVLVFITFVYWVISYLMAQISQRLEVALGVGER